MNRRIVSNIERIDGDVVSKGNDGSYVHLFQKQGSLDGACATYSVMMNLLVLGTISETDLQLGQEYTTKASKKLFKIFCEENGMHRDGQTFYKINKMLKEGFSSEIVAKHRLTSGRVTVDEIADCIDNNDVPVVTCIGYFGTSDYHAILVVGYEEENGTIHKLLCLDTGGEEPKGKKKWNAEMNVFRKECLFDYDVFGYEEVKVELYDIIIIKKR